MNGDQNTLEEEQWAKTTTQWTPKGKKKWQDELDAFLEDWPTTAQDREKWKEGRGAFALHWDNTGL